MKMMYASAGLLALTCLAPLATAEPLDKCTDLTPIFDFDAPGCASQVIGTVPPLYEHVQGVFAAACPPQRTVYDDVIGGPATGTPCLSVTW
jgi:hypothetical protein